VSGYSNGLSGLTSAEIYFPAKIKKTCSIRQLLFTRPSLTLDISNQQIIGCGGAYDVNNKSTVHTMSSCVTLTRNGWTHLHFLQTPRMGHTSWASPDGLMLFGGYHEHYTAENIESGAGQLHLNISYPASWGACAINDHQSTVITGGLAEDGITARNSVFKFNQQGFVESLPPMRQPRMAHGCGEFELDGVRVLIVAGGLSGKTLLDSTEMLATDNSIKSWVQHNPLPKKIYWPSSLSFSNLVYVLGGESEDGTIPDVYEFNGVLWKKHGELSIPRSASASILVKYNMLKHFCTN